MGWGGGRFGWRRRRRRRRLLFDHQSQRIDVGDASDAPSSARDESPKVEVGNTPVLRFRLFDWPTNGERCHHGASGRSIMDDGPVVDCAWFMQTTRWPHCRRPGRATANRKAYSILHGERERERERERAEPIGRCAPRRRWVRRMPRMLGRRTRRVISRARPICGPSAARYWRGARLFHPLGPRRRPE